MRWGQGILGCRPWLAESPPGVAPEIDLALIAALLLPFDTGQAPNRRMMALIQRYLPAWRNWSGGAAQNPEQVRRGTGNG